MNSVIIACLTAPLTLIGLPDQKVVCITAGMRRIDLHLICQLINVSLVQPMANGFFKT